MFAKMIAATAATALSIAPIAAAAQPGNSASRLSVAKSVRAAAPTRGAEKATGAGSIGVYVVGAALLVGFGFLVVKNAEDNDSDSN